LPDGSARITIEFKYFPYLELSSEQLRDVKASLAEEIASVCSIGNGSVVDLYGKDTSVSIEPDGTVSAFVIEVAGLSANELALKLYTTAFRAALVNSTLAVLGANRQSLSAGAISFRPDAFVPLVPTTTTTSTSSTVTESSTAIANCVNGTTTLEGDGLEFTDRATTLVSRLAWLCLVCISQGMDGIWGA
jgi:hypothetical protein